MNEVLLPHHEGHYAASLPVSPAALLPVHYERQLVNRSKRFFDALQLQQPQNLFCSNKQPLNPGSFLWGSQIL